jgi:hypothetical protein
LKQHGRCANSIADAKFPHLDAAKNMGVASRVADYAQKPALHEGRGMVAGRKINVRTAHRFPGFF